MSLNVFIKCIILRIYLEKIANFELNPLLILF